VVLFISVYMTTTVKASIPRYFVPIFYSINDLIKWIETTDAENFQSGRFRDCLTSLYEHNAILVPYFDNPDIFLTQIEVMPSFTEHGAFHDGQMTITFIYSTPFGQFFVFVSEVNPIRTEIYESEGIRGYAIALRGETHAIVSTINTTMFFRSSDTGELIEREVQYASFESFVDIPDHTGGYAMFIVDGFDVVVIYPCEERKTFFYELAFDIVPITPRPASTTPTLELPPSLAVSPSPQYINVRLAIGETIYHVNNHPHTMDVPPFIDPAYNRTMIPLRIVVEAFGKEVDWDKETRTVYIFTESGVSTIIIDEPLPNGMGVAVIVDDRTLVPLRYIAELIGATIYGEDSYRIIHLRYFIYSELT